MNSSVDTWKKGVVMLWSFAVRWVMYIGNNEDLVLPINTHLTVQDLAGLTLETTC